MLNTVQLSWNLTELGKMKLKTIDKLFTFIDLLILVDGFPFMYAYPAQGHFDVIHLDG